MGLEQGSVIEGTAASRAAVPDDPSGPRQQGALANGERRRAVPLYLCRRYTRGTLSADMLEVSKSSTKPALELCSRIPR